LIVQGSLLDLRRIGRARGRHLYKPHGELDGIGGGPMAGTAVPSFGLASAERFAARPDWRTRIEQRFHKLDLVHDLAEDIGTARWYRGFAAMIALGVAALAFLPDFSAVEAATTVHAGAAVRDEFRSQAIAPLALGGDSGRRMRASSLVMPLASVPERESLQLVATLGEGDSFGRMLQRAGVGVYDAALASDMVAAVMPIGDVKPGTRFDVTLGRRSAPGEPRQLDRLTFRARFDLDLAVERQGGALTINRRPVAVDATPLRIRGTVGPSLFRSARAAGAPMKAIEQYLQTVAAHLSLDGDIAPTDQFDMIVSYKRAAGGENEVGDLAYAGLERDGKQIAQLVRWKEGQFVDAATMNQPQIMSAGMVQPVNGRMTSPYGLRRHPILGYVRMHAGIDFGAAWGSPIFAVSDGVVAFAGRHGGHGNYVKLDHGGGLGSGYGHMSRIAVSWGAHVQAGQVIGYVGSSGLSTGPHLHYEAYQNGRTVNPLSISFASFRAASVDKGELDAVKGKIAALQKVAPGAALQKLVPKYAPAKGATKKASIESD
jgi:murein DD-endopeptidase MepM/ murein hydrolase activator NlpD